MTPALRILIADDEPMVLFLLQEFLVAEGFHVATASNGEEAIRISRVHCFDLFLIDLNMPGKDGIETILSLRATRKHTPIIAMSGAMGRGSGNYFPLARKLGACGTLAKPFDKYALLEAILSQTSGSARMAVI